MRAPPARAAWRRGFVAAGALALASLAGAQGGAPAAGPAPSNRLQVLHSATECEVWRREFSFAQSVEAHDTAAFAAHVHPGAVFNAGAVDAQRGRSTIVREWEPIIAGKDVVLRWRPGVVQIGGADDVALSRGPYVMEDLRPGAAVRWRVGWFQSVWVRERGGEWLVLFDGSPAAPRPVDSAEAARRHLEANSPADCVS
jgi:ketosteroid isomerase-like protein